MTGVKPATNALIDPKVLSRVEQDIAEWTVETEDHATRLAERLSAIAAHEKGIEAWFQPLKSTAYKNWQTLCAREKEALAPLARARAAGNMKLAQWRLREQRRREEIALRLRKEAERQAAALQLAAAAELEESGEPERAAAVVASPPPPAPLSPISTAPPKISGARFTKRWSAKVTDLGALIRWVAENPADRARYLMPNLTELNRDAVRLKSALSIPGVEPTDIEHAANL